MIQFEESANQQELFTLPQIEKSPEVTKVDGGIEQFRQRADAMIVNDDSSFAEAVDFTKQCKTGAKRIEEKRKFFVGPYNAVVKRINALFNAKIGALNEIEGVCKQKMLLYHAVKEEQAKKEAQRIAEENARKMSEAAESGEIPILNTQQSEPQKTTRTGNATATVKKLKEAVIEDFSKVPDEYKEPNMKKINRAINDGLTIPGIAIREKPSLSIR